MTVLEPDMVERLARYTQNQPEALYPPYAPGTPEPDGALPGGTFLLDHVAESIPIWGNSPEVLWSQGEPLYVFAMPNVGKTTLVQNLVLHRAGVREGDFLGFPVANDGKRVLYIAADRPKQILRSWRRMIGDLDRDRLDDGLTIYPGAPPFAISVSPDHLLPWVRQFRDIGTVVIDSLMDLAPGLAGDEGAGLAANAIANLIRDDIEVIVVHHDTKGDGEHRRPSMNMMYGGRALTRGAGSILYLDGEPGSGRAKLHQLKNPETKIGPYDLVHDGPTGLFTRAEAVRGTF